MICMIRTLAMSQNSVPTYTYSVHNGGFSAHFLESLQATPSCVCHGVCQCQSVQIDGVCRTVKLSISMVITREIYNIHHNIDGPSPNLAT